MPIYDKPTKELMREFVKIRPTTVQMHVEGMAINSGVRQHHSSGHDLFYIVAPGRFKLWDEAADPSPFYRSSGGEELNRASDEDQDDEADVALEQDSLGGAREFAYERDLRNYLAKNLSVLERGLAGDKAVRGFIVASDVTEDLKLATSRCPMSLYIATNSR